MFTVCDFVIALPFEMGNKKKVEQSRLITSSSSTKLGVDFVYSSQILITLSITLLIKKN